MVRSPPPVSGAVLLAAGPSLAEKQGNTLVINRPGIPVILRRSTGLSSLSMTPQASQLAGGRMLCGVQVEECCMSQQSCRMVRVDGRNAKVTSAHLSLLRAAEFTADATRKGPKVLGNAKKARSRSDKMEQNLGCPEAASVHFELRPWPPSSPSGKA